MATFRVSVPVDPRTGKPRNNCSCGCATRSKPVKLNSFEKRLRRTWLAELERNKAKSLPSPGKAPSRQSAGDMRSAAGTTRLIPRQAPYASARDRERAAAFLPESTLIAHLARTDTKAAAAVASAITERRALAAKAASYEPATAGRQVYASERDTQRARDFAPPSSLDVWKAMQGKVPASDAVEDENKTTRDALEHENAMKDILQGKKPATRGAPKSDRRR